MPETVGEYGPAGDRDRVLIMNPGSGTADHADRVHELAAEYGFSVYETERAEHAVDLARAAAPGADLLAAAGGDGTLNEVLQGAYESGAPPTTEYAVVPCGTGNNFAKNVGVRDVEHAFAVAAGEEGRTRRIDLGVLEAGDDRRVFVNSCIAGLTADASGDTSSDMKESLGTLAYVVNTLQRAVDYDGMRLHVETGPTADDWVGDALFALVGNGRRYPDPAVEGTQADLEDGMFDVTLIEDAPTQDLVLGKISDRLLGGAREIDRFRTETLTIAALQDDAVGYSLDGEMVEGHDVTLRTDPGALRMHVGPDYTITPG